MGLMDILTGGENEKAQAALQQALAQMQQVPVPTANDLQLTPFQQYTETGQLTPAMMEAAQVGPSAFNAENLSSVPMSVMQQALAQEGQIANAQGMTPQEKASIAMAEEEANRNTAGQRGAIEQHFAQMGVPQSLIAAALENGTVGQNAQNQYLADLQAQGQAANQGITALQNEGTLAGQMYGQEANQANTVAAAQNALNQFNAQNTQQANLANQANQQASNTYNTENAQNLANENTTNANQRQLNNEVTAKTTAAQLALQKAGGLANVGESQAQQATAAGQQSAGLYGSLIGAGATAAAGPSTVIQTGHADGGEIPDLRPKVPATNFKSGGPVPGHPMVPGDSTKNDTVAAMLSPGEVVLPRTVVQNPRNLGTFLKAKAPDMAQRMAAHPSDLAQVIRALSMLRQGAA